MHGKGLFRVHGTVLILLACSTCSQARGGSPLAIDPQLEWATYLGGRGDEGAIGACVSEDGTVTIAGGTLGPLDFDWAGQERREAEVGPLGGGDIFVARFSQGGERLLSLTFLGGSEVDLPLALAVDEAGTITLAGATMSADLPVTAGAFQEDFAHEGAAGTASDGFLLQLELDGDGVASELAYSTFFGGSGAALLGDEWFMAVDEAIVDLKLDESGGVVVCGITPSRAEEGFPVTPGAFQEEHGGGQFDAFVARIVPDRTLSPEMQLRYSTFLGGAGTEASPEDLWHRWVGQAVALDGDGNAVVVGHTSSPDFPTTENALDRSQGDPGGPPCPLGSLCWPYDAYVTVLPLDPDTPLVYSTFLGGNSSEAATAVAVDRAGHLYVSGIASSPEFFPSPLDDRSYDPSHNGGGDIFVARLDPELDPENQLVYGTFIGGSLHESAIGIHVSESGELTVYGASGSSDFPRTEGQNLSGPQDVCLLRLDPDPSKPRQEQLVFSCLLGGSGIEGPFTSTTPAVDASGNVVLASQTNSRDFPATTGAFDEDFDGIFDAFVARIRVAPPPTRFLRGDGNDDGKVDIADASYLLNWLFLGGPEPPCRAAGNVNGEGRVDIADASYLLNHLFLGGPPPVPPFPVCGEPSGAAEEELRCERAVGCD